MLFTLLTIQVFAAHAGDILIEDVTVVTPDLEQPLPHRHVLIRGERIAAVSVEPIEAAPDAQRIDGRGKFLTPGIMDSHVHVSHPPGLPPASDDPLLDALKESFVRQQPRSYLYFGVTQILDTANSPEGIAAFEAQPMHPDVFRCGAAPALDGYPAVFAPAPARYEMMPDYIFEPANADRYPLPAGADASRHTPEAVVRGIAASGAHCVKIFIEDGFGGATHWPILSMESLLKVRAATRKHGLPLVAHANALGMQQIALAADVDVIAHGLWNWDALEGRPGVPEGIAAHLRKVREEQTGFQPTIRVIPGMGDLFRHDTLEDPFYEKVVPPDLLEWYASDAGGWFKDELRQDFGDETDMEIAHIYVKVAARGMRAAEFLHDLGHPLLLGSDTPSSPTYGNQPGYDTYREMRFMAQSGIPLDAIFRAATINNARQFKLDRDYGTVAEGKIANLLLLDANPLETVRAFSLIDKVVLRGTVIERETLAADR
ncbi:MAG TPA: amidohydrolase family protein [Woeseiaceae bacterium]|nr:amidohydrolase family protein [Woeseiaceae bacterium]